jgi:hypothetical protein
MYNLLNKGTKKVQDFMKRNNYITVCDYEKDGNTVVEFAKVCAGVSVKNVIIIFNEKWRVIEIKSL